MKLTELLKKLFAAAICSAIICGSTLLCSSATAQQPFRPEPDNGDQDEEPGEIPLIIRPEADRAPARPFREPRDLEDIPDQAVLLNVKFAGWQEAGTGRNRDRLSKKLRANWVMVDSNGLFDGHVIAGEGAGLDGMIVYLMHMGRMIKDTDVDADGKFEFRNVRQGAYALIGWGPKGLFAYGLNILDYNEDALSSVPRHIDVIAFQNETTINTDWIRHFAPAVSYRVYGRYPTGEGEDDPPSLYGFEGLEKYHPSAKPASSIAAQAIARTSDGRLLGRVHQLTSEDGRPVDVRSTKVMLLKGDEVVVSTETDNFGVFEFAGVPNGQYGLVAAGSDGMGIIGIDVSEGGVMNDQGELTGDSTGELIDFCLVPSETIGWLNHYATEVAYRRNLLAPRAPRNDDKRPCDNCNGSGCNQCQGTGLCTSRCQSFEDWAARCLGQEQKTKFGSGYILSEGSKDLRRGVQRTGKLFEDAFYGDGNSTLGGSSGYGPNDGSNYGGSGYDGNYGGNYGP